MRILIAEDDVVTCRMVANAVSKWGYQVVLCEDGLEALDTLQRPDPPKLALLDWGLPGASGVEVCRQVRAANREPYIYIILMTSRDTTEAWIEGMGAGADDYVPKPFVPDRLRARLRAGRRILDLQEELIAAREALRELATHDPLTGLWNRAVVLEFLQRELARKPAAEAVVSVVMLDLDHFKRVNDTYGHLAGDVALAETARRMRACLRTHDLTGRYGGEEFLVVLPDCPTDAAVNLAHRLREAVKAAPMDTSEGLFTITCSLGVATHRGPGRMSAQELIRQADAALYRAKELGRDRVEAADTLGPAVHAGLRRPPFVSLPFSVPPA